ncbi:MAG TPA: hypothetical protein VFX59_29460 [Polyangiales bacterium]|nr:hypothetical protein [Polyangiales bacterium]
MSRYALCALVGVLAAGQASGQEAKTQSLLGPGLYVFQTRTRGSSCKDSEKDGYVMSFLAAVDGVPGSTTMTMQLVNNQHFTRWSLQVADEGTLSGSSKMGTTPGAPETHFTAKLEGERWKGAGARTYNSVFEGKPTRCRVDYDALLRRIDARPQAEP